MDIHGKYALVTGGAEGIGRFLVEILLKKGIKGVAILDINQSKGEETRKEFAEIYGDEKILFIKCDISSKEEMRAAFQDIITKFGRLDVVCNNAVVLDEVNWEHMFRVNLNGTINGTLLAIENMTGDQGGVVINISSMASLLGGASERLLIPGYTTSKSAINAFSRNIALFDPVVKQKGVRVNIVCPLHVIDKPIGDAKHRSADSELIPRPKPNPEMMKTRVLNKGTCRMQDVADAMMMLIENDHNAQTVMSRAGSPTIVMDCHQAFRQSFPMGEK